MGYKYKVNHEYFDKIDSEYKAYILGFIYADGSIIQPKGNRQMNLRIAIQEEDGYILEKFAKDAAGGQIKVMNPPAVQKRGWKKRTIVSIVSDRLCNKLIELGCKPNKSKVGMSFPKLDNQYIRHFIRGFLDGDGYIGQKKVHYLYVRKTEGMRRSSHHQRYQLRMALTSTDLKFLEDVMKHLKIKKCYWRCVTRTQLVYTVWIDTVESFDIAVEFLYKDAKYYLERKFNKTIKSRASGKTEEGLETRDTTVSPEHPAPTVK